MSALYPGAAGLLLLLSTSAGLQAQTFVKWSFENSQLTPVFDYSADQASQLSLVQDVTSVIVPGLSGSAHALGTYQYGSSSDRAERGIEIMVNTSGKNGIVFSWEMKAEADASAYYRLYYTTNSGTNWIPASLGSLNVSVTGGGKTETAQNLVHITSAGTATRVVVDFSSIHTVDNNARFGLRITGVEHPQTATYQPVAGAQYDPEALVIFDNLALGKNSALPIRVSSFSAVRTGSSLLRFHWTTESEEAFSHFELQRSTDGVTFSTVGSVSASNNHLSNTYNYTDAPPMPGTYLYRLRIVDQDQSALYASVLRLQTGDDELKPVLYPVPADAQLSVQASLSPGDALRIFGADGRLWLEQKMQQPVQTFSLPVSVLPPGIYFLEIANALQSRRIAWQKR